MTTRPVHEKLVENPAVGVHLNPTGQTNVWVA